MRLRVEGPGAGQHFTRVFVDDAEVKELGDVRVELPVDGVVRAYLTVNVTEAFAFTGGADLHVTAVVLPGYRLLKVEQGGVTAYVAERIFDEFVDGGGE